MLSTVEGHSQPAAEILFFLVKLARKPKSNFERSGVISSRLFHNRVSGPSVVSGMQVQIHRILGQAQIRQEAHFLYR